MHNSRIVCAGENSSGAIQSSMNPENLREIICLLENRDISELSIESGNESLKIKRSVSAQSLAMTEFPPLLTPGTSPAPLSSSNGLDSHAVTTKGSLQEELHFLKSSTVGIFRESKSNGGQPLVQPGANVAAGQVVGFIEVLRLFNEVQSDVAGEIVEKTVGHGERVEYGQVLFAIRRGA